MTDQPCDHCTYGIPAAADRCPHCGLPGLFPNVRAAEQPANRAALRDRYEAARASATRRGALPTLENFESELARSRAVLGRSAGEVDRLASSERQGYASYYELIEAEVRLPDDDEWDSLRRLADSALFPGYEKHMRFLALSLDDTGLDSYGECFLVCKDSLIEHRATVFEANSTVFLGDQPSKLGELQSAILGRRAVYKDRATLCTAKLGDRLSTDTAVEDFAGVLMTRGPTSIDDDFVEVNIYGPMSIRTFQKVVVDRSRVRRKTQLRALEERLSHFGVELEVR